MSGKYHVLTFPLIYRNNSVLIFKTLLLPIRVCESVHVGKIVKNFEKLMIFPTVIHEPKPCLHVLFMVRYEVLMLRG